MKRLLLVLLIAIGVGTQAQTTNYTALAGPYGGSPQKIISNSSGDLLAVKNGVGVYKSADGGLTWAASNSGLLDNSINDIYRDDATGKIYALGSSRFYTSSDGGTSWVVTASTGFTNGRLMAKGPSGNLFIVGGNNSTTVYRSPTGVTWSERFTFSSTYVEIFDFEFNSAGNMFIAARGGIYTAPEVGLSATQLGLAAGIGVSATYNPSNNILPDVYSIAISGTDIYASTQFGPYKSSNNGTSWATVGTGLTCCFYNSIIEKDPSGNIYLFNNYDVWKLVGTAWTRSNSPIVSPSSGTLKSVYFASASTYFVGVDGIGLYKTTNSGAAWSAVINGYTGLNVNQILFTDNNRILMAYGYPYGIEMSLDDGASWDFVNTGVTNRGISRFLKVGSTIFGYGSGIIKSIDNATSWTEVNNGAFPLPYFNNIVSNDGTTMYSYDTYVYIPASNSYEYKFGLQKSTNGGVTWTRSLITGTGFPTTSQTAYINDEGFSLDNAGNIYMSINNNSTGKMELYKVSGTTSVATQITNVPVTNVNTRIQDVKTLNGKLYAITNDNKLHISSNAGTSWTSKTVPVSQNQTLRIINDNTIYILGTSLYISTDAANSWVNTGTFTQTVQDVVVSSTNFSYVAVPYSKYYKSNGVVIPPSPPTNLTVTGFSVFEVGLKWDDNSNTETDFIIERSEGNNTSYDSIDSWGMDNPTSYIIYPYVAAPKQNTLYYYRVRAVGAAGKSAYSNEVSVTTLLNCQNYTLPANRSWTATTQNLSGLGTFSNPAVSITGSLGTYTISNLTLGWGASPTISPAIPGITGASFYEACGSIYLPNGGSVYSNGNGTWNPTTNTLTINWQTRPDYTPYKSERTVFVLNATDPVPAAPSNAGAYIKTSSEIVVTWTGGLYSQQYQVQRSTISGSGFVDVGSPVNFPSASFVDNNALVAGTTYYYRIKAKSVGGDFTNATKYSTSAEVALQFQTPMFEATNLPNFDNSTQGIAWIDIDNDNDEDLLVTPFNLPNTSIAVFENVAGVMTKVTAPGISDYAVLTEATFATVRSLSVGDINNDGLTDFLSQGSQTGGDVWINKGAKVFERTNLVAGNTSALNWFATMADLNNDGRLDAVVSDDFFNSVTSVSTTPLRFFTQNNQGVFTPYELGEIAAETSLSRVGSFADYDNDGDQDFLKSRFNNTPADFDQLYKNNGDGTFTPVTGTAFEADFAIASRSISWADYDNDLDLDAFVAHNGATASIPNQNPSMLYQNNGNGTFTRLTTSLLSEPKTVQTFGSAWGDVDNDGDLDMLVANSLQSVLYLNNGVGVFTKYIGAEYLVAADPVRTNIAFAFADYDNNGTLDIATGKNLANFPTILLKNNLVVGANTRWLKVKLVGTVSNRSGIGARIVITTTDGKKQMRAISANSGYGSASSLIAHFGLRNQASVTRIDVYWPSGIHTIISTPTTPNQFITITEDGTPPAIVSVSPVTGSANVPVDAKLEITFGETPLAVAGKKIILSTGSTVVKEFLATEGVIAGSKVTFTPPATLTQFTTYTVSVEAGAFADAGGNGTAAIAAANWTFTIIDTTSPVIAAFTPPATLDKGFATSAAYKLTVTDNSSTVSSVVMAYRKVAGGGFTDLPGTLASGTWNFAVAETMFDATGLEFYFTAKDAANNTARLPATADATLFTYLSYKTAVNILPTDKIGFGGLKTSWKIISIPFDLGSNNSVAAIFKDFSSAIRNDKAQFRILNYIGTSGWGEFPGNFSTFDRGKGYFINIKDPITTNVTLPDATAPTNTRNNLFQITLKKGWNQIGNPYLTPIVWADVVAYSGNAGKLPSTGATLKKFVNGNYTDGTDLQPFEGGFVNSASDADVVISIPFSGQTAPGGRVAQVSSDLGSENWKLALHLSQQDVTNVFGGIGMNRDASVSIDDFDNINPPRFFDYTEINFAHPEYFMKNFSMDVVPAQKEYTWSFNVDSNVEGDAQLNWDNSLFGENNKQLFLFDVTHQAAIDMRTENSYSFNPSSSRQFRVYYGENLKDKVNPDFVSLGEPYPNPSAAKTTIPFRLPGQDVTYNVKLEVYDMLGKKVATLIEGDYKSGFHAAVWNTEDANLVNGVYTVRFIVGGKNSAVLNKKVMLSK